MNTIVESLLCPHLVEDLVQVEEDRVSCTSCGVELRRLSAGTLGFPACPKCEGAGDYRTRAGQVCWWCAYGGQQT